MNSLSWFLYLADVLPNTAEFVRVSASVIGATSLFTVGVLWCTSYDSRKPELTEKHGKNMKYVLTKIIPVCFILCLLASLVPSKEVIYLIAGSEASEFVVTSEYGQELLGDIKLVIEAQVENLKGN